MGTCDCGDDVAAHRVCECGGLIHADPHGRFDDLCSTCIDESDRERERARRNTGATAQDEEEGIR